MSFNNANTSNSPLAARMAGVRVAREGTSDSDRGEPLKVIGVTEATWVVVAFCDERGVPCNGLFLKVGEDYYSTKDTVQWCSSLLPMNSRLRQQLNDRKKQSAPVEIPAADDVDVVAP